MSAVNPEEPIEAHEPVQVPERLSFTSPPALLTSVVLAGVLLIFALYGWYALGPDIRSQVSWAQGGTLLFMVLLMIGILLSVGYSRLWADEKGVTVRNGPVLRTFPVEKIAGLRLRTGDAWAYLLIKEEDGGVKRRAVLSIQQLEGNAGRKKLRELRDWLKAHGATSKDVTLTDD